MSNISVIQRALGLILEPGHVYELRCPKAGKWKTVSLTGAQAAPNRLMWART